MEKPVLVLLVFYLLFGDGPVFIVKSCEPDGPGVTLIIFPKHVRDLRLTHLLIARQVNLNILVWNTVRGE